ncbi:hypothetical protein ZOSMA_419G00020 [Zostera marina]|uniref:Uncharacterized protein n=1 Tax=Zostera marina TaxID=29655 RepID=A0A0K9P527_ZOSMR|nr:hypothetical protein ZOSMA_419G00020 [Zostera marina]
MSVKPQQMALLRPNIQLYEWRKRCIKQRI